jgi:hypothetical protein
MQLVAYDIVKAVKLPPGVHVPPADVDAMIPRIRKDLRQRVPLMPLVRGIAN